MKKMLFIILILVYSLISLNIYSVQAETLFEKSLNKFAPGAGYEISDAKEGTLEAKIGSVIQSILSFLGVIFMALMIYGGFLWMTARGNEQQVDKAKNLIAAAIIGLVIVISAYAISFLVIKSLGESALQEGK